MEFTRQLVAFIILIENSNGLINVGPEDLEDLWIAIANSNSESGLRELLGSEGAEPFNLWIEKWIEKMTELSVEELTPVEAYEVGQEIVTELQRSAVDNLRPLGDPGSAEGVETSNEPDFGDKLGAQNLQGPSEKVTSKNVSNGNVQSVQKRRSKRVKSNKG